MSLWHIITNAMSISVAQKRIITPTWLISEIAKQFPQTEQVFAEYNLHCFQCAIGVVETLEEGCHAHGLTDEDIDLLVTDLNDYITDVPKKPKKLDITKRAAEEIKKMGEGNMLFVQANEDGSFCMEFRSKKEPDEEEFCCEEVPEVRVCASGENLERIGGAKIDFNDGAFKLEMRDG